MNDTLQQVLSVALPHEWAFGSPKIMEKEKNRLEINGFCRYYMLLLTEHKSQFI